MKKKLLSLLLVGGMSLSLLTECGAATTEDNTTETIQGIIQWGEGGGTDSVMRPLAAIASDELGTEIVCENMTGNAGAVATEYVYNASADGKTLLMGAENPALYTALDISELTYSNFKPVFLVGDESVGVVVGKDSPYNTLTDLIEAALAAPVTIKLATTGEGGLPWEVASFLTAVTGATFAPRAYDSDASALAAVVDGECDFTIAKVQTGLAAHENGDVTFISMLSNEPVEVMSSVSLIVDEYPEFAGYLPWGPFYGVFVKADTSDKAFEALQKAFTAAYESDAYQETLQQLHINGLGFSGDKAKEYIEAWSANTVELLYNSGAIDKSAEQLGLE